MFLDDHWSEDIYIILQTYKLYNKGILTGKEYVNDWLRIFQQNIYFMQSDRNVF